MNTATARAVTLPSGKKVQISDIPLPWWSEDGGSGHVDPHLLAPDPDQPRQYVSALDLAGLKASIKSRGVREPILVTPRLTAPWVTLPPNHSQLPFVIVSGHLRTESAIDVALSAVPIRVAIYDTELEYRLDASVLNKQHRQLTPLDEGYEFVSLMRHGATIRHLQDGFGCSDATVYSRMGLTRLPPELQQLIPPLAPRGAFALVPSVGGHLGLLRDPGHQKLDGLFQSYRKVLREAHLSRETATATPDERRSLFQRALWEIIKFRTMTSTQAISFIRAARESEQISAGSLGLADDEVSPMGAKSHAAFEPRRRRIVLSSVARAVIGSTAAIWTSDDVIRSLETASSDEIDVLATQFSRARDILTTLLQHIQTAQKKRAA